VTLFARHFLSRSSLLLHRDLKAPLLPVTEGFSPKASQTSVIGVKGARVCYIFFFRLLIHPPGLLLLLMMQLSW
jgi:hypothetical protein